MANNKAFRDLGISLQQWQLVAYLALSDVKSRYKRSVLGPLWLTLGTAIGAAGLGFIWSELFKLDRSVFVPTLTAGLILWQLIAGVLTESSTAFTSKAHILKNINLPLSLYPLQIVLRHSINFLHNIPVFFIVAIVLSHELNFNLLWLLPAFALVVLNLLWMCLLLAMFGARYRDVEHTVAMVVPVLMFVSPVFYRPNYLPFNEMIIWFNPLSHLIEVVRYPLLGSSPPLFVLLTCTGILIIGWAFTLAMFARYRSRITYWI